jgi:hypothetical protein
MVLHFPNHQGRLQGREAGPHTAGRHEILFKENEIQKICREVLKFNAMCRPLGLVKYVFEEIID